MQHPKILTGAVVTFTCFASTVTSYSSETAIFCGGKDNAQQIEYVIDSNSKEDWNAMITFNGTATKAMTSYSYFGNSKPPENFVVALLGENKSEVFVFEKDADTWLELGDSTYRKCN